MNPAGSASSSSRPPPLVIVGASYAGTQLADSLRRLGYDAPIIMLGDEAHAPYQRPPLSKGLLSGKSSAASLALKGPDFFREQDIELRLGTRAVALDPGRQTLSLADGSALRYGGLALATGARCRTLALPGASLAGVHNLRTLDDALALDAALSGASRACIIGGGFIGLEAAAALTGRGLKVTLIETHPQLLARSLPAAMACYLEQKQRDSGVDIRLGQGVRQLRGAAGRVTGVELADGSVLDCDLVVLGIGVQPNDELARQAGIACDNGILTDALGRTDAPHVYAIGDVANALQPEVPGMPRRLRLESIQAANDGARALASALAGRPEPYTGAPWFWSDQFALKLQMAGLALPGDETVIRGDMAADRFSVFYLRNGRIAAAHSINRPGEHMLSRKLISAAIPATPEMLRDESFDLKHLAASA